MALTFCLTRLRFTTASEDFFACRCEIRTNLGQPMGKNSFASPPKGSQCRPPMREMVAGLDEVLGLHDIAGGLLRDTRTGHNRLHSLVGLLRQSVFGRLAGYDDVNDADLLALDPVMRQVVGGRAVDAKAASASQTGRFETEVLAKTDNRAALAEMSGHWIGRVHSAMPPKWITLDMDSSFSPTHGAQEGTAWNGHFGCM